VRDWAPDTLQLVWVDLWTIVNMIRQPSVGIYYPPVDRPRPGQPPGAIGVVGRRIIYSGSEITKLKAMAKDVVARGGENRVLRRGALLHADIAMLAPFQNVPSRRPPDRPGRISVRMNDGQQTGVTGIDVHFELGRRLLDFVQVQDSRGARAGPAADETTRLWYVAIGSYLQASGEMDFWHVDRSLQLFPRDADVLFLAGCLHEMASSPQVQSVLEAMELPKGMTSVARGEGAALREAERLFRQSLEGNPLDDEARIRLGRVIGRRGRHEEATRELRRAVAATRNPLLLYYGNLFLGAELEALGRTGDAREVYERASTLYPRAQSPRLALSALAQRTGNRAEALRAIEPVLGRGEVDLGDDPWWIYYRAQGRATDVLLAELRRRIEDETQP